MKKIQFIVLSLLASLTFSVKAQAPAAAVSTEPKLVDKVEANGNPLIIPYEKWKLPNGLTVILSEDHSDPVVHVRITYHVGSAREGIGKSGFAHFYEHMMFEGSEHVKDKEHFKIVSEVGGNLNGNTERDITNYFETVPSNALETALWLESDRCGFLLDSLSDKKFENQRATVKNEKSQNVENQPYTMAFVEYINQILYPPKHPYSWPVIGYVEDLNNASLQDLKNFFLRWYGPNNAVISLTGDVNPKEALALVTKYFGNIAPCPEVKKMRVPEPVLSVDQYFNYTDNAYLPLTLMVYPTNPKYSKDEPALDLLADMMGGSNNSIFYKNFVKPEKALQASVYHSTDELAGEFTINVFAYPGFDPSQIGKDFNETEKLIRSTIEDFEKTGITDEALQRSKAKVEAGITNLASSVTGKGTMLNMWEVMLGKPYNLNDELNRYNAVTKEDIIRVYGKYLKGKKAAFVNVYPANPMSKDSIKSFDPNASYAVKDNPEYKGLKYVKAKDNFDRAKRPTMGASKVPQIPAYYTSTMKNGLKVIGTQTNEVPEVELVIEIKGGSLPFAADLKKYDVPSMTSAMMNEGTQNYTTEQISAELEKLGSDINFYSSKTKCYVSVSCLTKNLDATLKLLEEKLLHPKFNPEDFKRVKKQKFEEEMNNKRVADVAAQKMFGSMLFGNNVLGTYSTAKGMDRVSLKDCEAYYVSYYSPSVAQLIIVGNLKESEIMPKLQFLEKWKAVDVKLPEIPVLASTEPTTIYLVHKDNAAQSVIAMGHIAMPYDYSGDYFKANVMNFSLGGNFNGHLNMNLREDKGWTYGIYSYFTGTKTEGFFGTFTSVRTSATDSAMSEINKEIRNYVKNGITEEELEFTKSSLLNSESLRYETPGQKVNFLSRIAEFNLPKDYTAQQATVLKGMTRADINARAAQFIHPDKMVIVVVGNKWLVKKPLENLGLGKVKEVTLD